MTSFPRGLAQSVLSHCQEIARFSDDLTGITRTFLSPAMRQCLDYFIAWAERIGLSDIGVDAAGNFRATRKGSRRIVIGSHLDTVPNAGAFDGVLGVVMGMVLAESFDGIEIVGFSEEEGVRFKRPFIGSLAYVGKLDDDFLGQQDQTGVTVKQALSSFGLDGAPAAQRRKSDVAGFLEFHIEQGPWLESLQLPLGVVEAIAGQTRAHIEFIGKANHAGTTPMHLRQDAFCAAAEWALFVERTAGETDGLVATVGRVDVAPGVGNVVPGKVTVSLDVRHAQDAVRCHAFQQYLGKGHELAARRNVAFESTVRLDQAAVAMDSGMVERIEQAVAATGVKPFRMTSGAGHDAMILAKHIPSAMIFLRSPGGVSHHPAETVLVEDIDLALQAGRHFMEQFS